MLRLLVLFVVSLILQGCGPKHEEPGISSWRRNLGDTKLTGVAWFPDGKSLVVGTIGREQDHPDLGCWGHFCEVFGNQWVRIVTESQSEWQISCFQYLEWGCFEKGLLPQAVGSQYWYELEDICPVFRQVFFQCYCIQPWWQACCFRGQLRAKQP